MSGGAGRGSKAQREEDIIELVVWHELARSAGLLRRRSGRLVTTPAGRAAATDDASAWRALAAGLVGEEGWVAFLRESALLVLLEAGEDGVANEDMDTTLALLAIDAGWHDQATGGSPSADAISSGSVVLWKASATREATSLRGPSPP